MSAFLMTLLAGMSTGVGSLIAFFSKKTNQKFLVASLGFSAGVMIYVSMIELFQTAKSLLSGQIGSTAASHLSAVSFFVGILLIALIDRMIPEQKNPMVRTGAVTAIAIGIHNFPEGLATFVSAHQEPEIAIPIVVAIAIHNIQEGVAVSVPIYHATGSKKKAFGYSVLSGLFEPVGALIGWFLLMPVMNMVVYGCIFALIAGIMVFISVDELLPAASECGEHHVSVYGMVAGMFVMAVSLELFRI